MLTYRCVHCGRALGLFPQDVDPDCPDHPQGVVEVFEDADPDTQ